ncbi:proton-coupled folate transporter-like [Littorina saxatilis]|uniref:Proton-coupled folate transporter n=1 Tax=Littorina saxatilis TaxID=31220 RepID=A0AAN9BGV1_9CAEN
MAGNLIQAADSPTGQEPTRSIADEIAAALNPSAESGYVEDWSRKTPDRFLRHGGRVEDDLTHSEIERHNHVHSRDTSGGVGSSSANGAAGTSSVLGRRKIQTTRVGSQTCADDILSDSDDSTASDTAPLLRNKTHRSEDGPPPRKIPRQKRSLFFISLVSIFVSVSDRMAEPVLEQYVYQVYTQQVYGNASVMVQITKTPCVNTSNTSTVQADRLRDMVQDKSADLLMFLEMLTFGIGMVSCLLLGTYSDVMGRRLALLVPLIGHFLRDAAAPVIIHFDLGLPALYVGYAIFGVCGGTAGVFLACYVYSADITTTEKERMLGLALVMGALGTGNAVSQFSAGIFIQKTGFFFPSLTAGMFDLLCIFIVIAFLPETVTRDRKCMMTPWGSLKRIWTTFSSRDNPHQRALLLVLLLAFFIGVFGDYPAMKLDVLYLMDQPFCWSSSQIGLLESIKVGVSRLASLLMLLPLQRVMSATCLAIFGALSFLASNVLIGLAEGDLLVYLGGAAAAGCSIMFAAVRAMMSRMVPVDRLGALFGGIAVTESVCFGVSQVTTFTVYKAVVSFMPGITYFCLAGCFFVCIILFMIHGCLLRKSKILAVPPVNIQTVVEDPSDTKTLSATHSVVISS